MLREVRYIMDLTNPKIYWTGEPGDERFELPYNCPKPKCLTIHVDFKENGASGKEATAEEELVWCNRIQILENMIQEICRTMALEYAFRDVRWLEVGFRKVH